MDSKKKKKKFTCKIVVGPIKNEWVTTTYIAEPEITHKMNNNGHWITFEYLQLSLIDNVE